MDDARPESAEFVGRDSLDRGLRADRHEDRRLHIPSPRVENPRPRLAGAVGLEKGEGGDGTHVRNWE